MNTETVKAENARFIDLARIENELERRMAKARRQLDNPLTEGTQLRVFASARLTVYAKVKERLQCGSTREWLLDCEEFATNEALSAATATSVFSDAIVQLREDAEGRAWAEAAVLIRQHTQGDGE